jgi:hypothetical protein
MRLLLDTHAFIWTLTDSARLTSAARAEQNMNRSRMLLIYVAVLFGWLSYSNTAAGQSSVDSQKPAALAVEITGRDLSPFTVTVYEEGTFETSWCGDIPRTDLVLADNDQKGLNIPIKTRMEGDAVRVDIRVGLVSFKEVAVATYLIRPGEKVVVQEVGSYGFAPFTLKVIRIEIKPPVVIPPLSALPEIGNNVNSIKVIGLERGKSADLFWLSLQNTSKKNIIALEIIMPTGGIGREISERDKSLILAGAIYKSNISAQQVGRITDEGFEPALAQPRAMINAALFEDGTYEGDYVSAATMEAWRRGRKIQREKVIALLEKALGSERQGSPIKLAVVKEGIYSLQVDGDATTLEEISKHFPPLGDRLEYVAQSIKDVMAVEKWELITLLKTYEEQVHSAGGDGLRIWITRTKAHYERLLNSH